MTATRATAANSGPAAPVNRPGSARSQRLRLRRVGALAAVAGAYLALAGAHVLPEDLRNDSPAYVWAVWAAFMIRTFTFHLGLALAAVALCTVVMRRYRLLCATAPLAVFTLGPELWTYLPRRTPAVAGETIRVMSCNLLQSNSETAAILAEIRAVGPDLLLLQEYATHWREVLEPALAAEYPYRYHEERSDCFGLAIYSRRPWIGQLESRLPLGTLGLPQARAVVQIAGQEVAFYNVHLMPPKTRAWTAEQRRQWADLLALLREERRPFVLCGDFNFTHNSAFAGALRPLGLRDAHTLAGRGRGATWPNQAMCWLLPGVRIDHVYLSPSLTSISCRTGAGAGSDHRPIIAEIGFAR